MAISIAALVADSDSSNVSPTWHFCAQERSTGQSAAPNTAHAGVSEGARAKRRWCGPPVRERPRQRHMINHARRSSSGALGLVSISTKISRQPLRKHTQYVTLESPRRLQRNDALVSQLELVHRKCIKQLLRENNRNDVALLLRTLQRKRTWATKMHGVPFGTYARSSCQEIFRPGTSEALSVRCWIALNPVATAGKDRCYPNSPATNTRTHAHRMHTQTHMHFTHAHLKTPPNPLAAQRQNCRARTHRGSRPPYEPLSTRGRTP